MFPGVNSEQRNGSWRHHRINIDSDEVCLMAPGIATTRLFVVEMILKFFRAKKDLCMYSISERFKYLNKYLEFVKLIGYQDVYFFVNRRIRLGHCNALRVVKSD